MADENYYQYNTPPQGQQPPQQNDQNYNPFNGNMPPMPPQEEKASVGLAILSYLIPLVGLILYLTKKDSRPKTAKVCGKCALASVIINIVLTIILYAVMGGALLSGLSDEAAVDSSYAESYDDELAAETGSDSGNTSDNTVGDYTCVVKEQKYVRTGRTRTLFSSHMNLQTTLTAPSVLTWRLTQRRIRTESDWNPPSWTMIRT